MRSPFDGPRVVPLVCWLAVLACACDADPVVVLWEADAGGRRVRKSWLDCACSVGSVITCIVAHRHGGGCEGVMGERKCLPDGSWGACNGQPLSEIETDFVIQGESGRCLHLHTNCGLSAEHEELFNDCAAVSACNAADFSD